MEELQERIIALTSEEEAKYFYHITKFPADKILEDGLIVANPGWYQSFIELDRDSINNIEGIIKNNEGGNITDANYIIIAGVYLDEDGNIPNFIRELDDEEIPFINWEGVGNPNYIVDQEHLMGYIDLDTLQLIVNENANVMSDGLYL